MFSIINNFDQSKEYIYYINDCELNKTNFKSAKGFIECDLTFNFLYKLENQFKCANGIMYIVSLYIKEKYRGQGYGSALLKKIIDECRKTNTRVIMVDDMSSNYKKKRNIYVKHKFKYSNKNYGPEMTRLL
jgi:GNAT superfamily N-acetyltransferase